MVIYNNRGDYREFKKYPLEGGLFNCFITHYIMMKILMNIVIINLSLILVRSLEEMCEKYVEENEKSLLKKRFKRLSRRLAGKIDPAVIASIVREDREKR